MNPEDPAAWPLAVVTLVFLLFFLRFFLFPPRP